MAIVYLSKRPMKQPARIIERNRLERMHHKIDAQPRTERYNRNHARKMQYERNHVGNEWMNSKPYMPKMSCTPVGLRRKQVWANSD